MFRVRYNGWVLVRHSAKWLLPLVAVTKLLTGTGGVINNQVSRTDIGFCFIGPTYIAYYAVWPYCVLRLFKQDSM